MSRNGRPNNDQRPLLGVVLCWTAILPEQRSEMASVAQEMGASHKLDLTSDVTHLIVGSIDTPKYKYVAKERGDIKVLKVSWLDAVRDSWLQGEDTDIEALEEEHRLPTFYDLQICVTGFDDADIRQGLVDAVHNNGGFYHGDLTKKVTHLVAAAGIGKKYDYAGQWGIKRVAYEWVRDSLERKMALDEACYSLDRALEDRGKGAITYSPAAYKDQGKRLHNEDPSEQLIDDGRRKLRRTASMKLGSQSGNLWADMGQEDRVPRPKRELLTSDPTGPVDLPQSYIFDEPNLAEGEQASSAQSRASVSRDPPAGHFLDPGPEGNNHYLVFGFEEKKASLLENHMRRHGAVTSRTQRRTDTSNKDVDSIFWIVPHDADDQTDKDLQSSGIPIHDQDIWLTEIWLEKCLHSKKFVPAESHPLYEPFVAGHIAGCEGLVVCPTSFSGVDLLHFSKAVKATSAKYDETLNKQTSVLVCNSEASINPEKLRYALSNNIPVVSQQWLWDCMRSGELRKVDEYTLEKTGLTQSMSSARTNNPLSRTASTTLGASEPSVGQRPRPQSSRSRRVGKLEFSTEPKQSSIYHQDAPSHRKTTAASSPRGSSQALQDLSPNLSPRKGTKSQPQKRSQQISNNPTPKASLRPDQLHEEDSLLIAADESILRAAPSQSVVPEALDAPNEHLPTAHTINSAIAALKAHKSKAAAGINATTNIDVKPSSLPRKQRPLGRALSGSSTGRPISRQASFNADAPATLDSLDRPASRLGPFLLDSEEANSKPQYVPPSQALGYEDPEGAALRARLMSKHKYFDGAMDLDDEANPGMQRVQSIARVTDVNRDTIEEKNKRRAARRR